MQDGCRYIMDEHAWKVAATPADYAKFQSLLMRSFIELNKETRWCPNPRACDQAIRYVGLTHMCCSCGQHVAMTPVYGLAVV